MQRTQRQPVDWSCQDASIHGIRSLAARAVRRICFADPGFPVPIPSHAAPAAAASCAHAADASSSWLRGWFAPCWPIPQNKTPKARVLEGGSTMTVTHILKGKGQDIITLPPHRSMADAARLLAEKRIGAVVITGPDGAIAGILSERDVVRALAQSGAAALDHAISKHMTTKVA